MYASHYVWSVKTIQNIIVSTCLCLWNVLQPVYMPRPSREQYERIAARCEELWQLPNCLGFFDGKHIRMIKPDHSGSLYYNYKSYYSIVLLASCDADCMFTMVDVGAYGSQSDGGILKNSHFGRRFLSGQLPIPPPKSLPGSDEEVPHFFVGDAAFPLNKNIMRPYPGYHLTPDQRYTNYRLSRGRITIERAFGELFLITDYLII